MLFLRDVELRLDGSHGLDSIADPLQVFARFDVRHAPCLKLNQADDELVVVLGPVLELAKQGFLYLGQSEIFLQQFVLRPGKRQNRRISLKKLDVVLAEIGPSSAVDFEHAEYFVAASNDDVGGALDAVPAQELGRTEALLLVQFVGDDGSGGLKRVTGGRSQMPADRCATRNALHPSHPDTKRDVDGKADTE